MLTTLYHQHSRSISTALLAVMILSVLQFCMMSMAEGQMMSHGSSHESFHKMPDSHHGMLSEMAHETSHSDNVHDCCVTGSTLSHNMEDMDAACPDCEDSDPALQLSNTPDLKPLYALLYVVVQEVLNETLQTRIWQVFTEPDILSSRPDIYLANASFLE